MSDAALDAEAAYRDVRDFLHREAYLLDNGELRRWLEEMLTDDVHYEMPVRSTAMGSDEFFGPMYMDDNRYRLEKRIERLESEYAWAERPRSRLRHFVTNILVDGDGDELDARSNVLVLRNRSDDHFSDLLFGERQDELRRVDGELRLAHRVVLLDQSTVPIDDISFFI